MTRRENRIAQIRFSVSLDWVQVTETEDRVVLQSSDGRRAVSPVPKIVFKPAEGAPGPSLLGTGEVGSLITAAAFTLAAWMI